MSVHRKRAIARARQAEDHRPFWMMAGAIALAAFLMFVTGQAMASPQDTVNERIAVMKEIGGSLKALKGFTEGSVDQQKAIAAAALVKTNTAKIEALFPKGTGEMDEGVEKTRAGMAIWEDWGKFMEGIAALDQMADTLVAAAGAGDAGAVGAALSQAGPVCGGCHKPFRLPE